MTNTPKVGAGDGSRQPSCGVQNGRAIGAVCMALALASAVLLMRAVSLL